MNDIFLKVTPVEGAAEYFAEVDTENKNKPSVWMKTPDGYYSVIDTAKTMEAARNKANKWQLKENRAVLKSQHKI